MTDENIIGQSGIRRITEEGLCREIERQIKRHELYEDIQVNNFLGLTVYALKAGGKVVFDNKGEYVIFDKSVDRQVVQDILYKSTERQA